MRRSTVAAATLLLGLLAAGAWLSGLAPAARAASGDAVGSASLVRSGLVPEPEMLRIHPRLLKALETAGPETRLDIIVELRRPESLVRDLAAGKARPDAAAALVAGLQAEAALRAAAVIELAAAMGQGERLRVFWVSPMVALRAGPDLVSALAHLDDVLQIRLDERMRIANLDGEMLGADAALNLPNTLPWNLELINLGLVQPGLNLDGTGVVVANLDTGVDWTHPALHENYRGYAPGGPGSHAGNWHVSTGENLPFPADVFGHGTHTMGTMVGKVGPGGQIGVAPGTAWIAVKMIDDQGYFLESWAHDAFEWVMAPEGDPGLAPDIVNGSWGTSFPADLRFRADVQALRAAGILPVFSAGNAGPFESSLRSPADYPESLAVAAVDDIALVTIFSSRGPSLTPWAEIKPELAAPGVDVVSSVPGGRYFAADGTSMAAPHVAGTAALLLQAQPDLDPDALEEILLNSAAPLGQSVPNNDTGWGLVNAYAAAVAVSPHGEITGLVISGGGGPVLNPVVTATHSSGSPVIAVSGDSLGRFTLALAPGIYHLAAGGFGHAPAGLPSIPVSDGSVYSVEIALDLLPGGLFSGSVTDAVSGEGVTADLEVVGTGFTWASASDGAFAAELPAGNWEIAVRSRDHRVGRFSVTILAGEKETRQVSLIPAPSMLLVDSGRWYYNSQIPHFRSALDDLGYVYDVHDIRDPHGILTGASDVPPSSTLTLYDLVVWSAPYDSPGLVRASGAISDYLSLGGTLLVSGQDAAYWDAGGSLFVYPGYFPHFAGAWFDEEGAQAAVSGAAGTMMDGVTLALDGPGSVTAQFLPDTVRIADSLTGASAMIWPNGGTAALFSGGCRPHRLAWTGFGFEGAGPESVRVEAFGRVLAWLALPPPEIDLRLPDFTGPDIVLPGEISLRPVRVENAGTLTETFLFSLEGNLWPTALVPPNGEKSGEIYPLTLPGCSGMDLPVRVAVPEGLPYDVFDRVTISAVPSTDPAGAVSTTLTTKTPAPLLLLDDGLFIWFGDRYAATLDRLGMPYDYVSTDGAALEENILKRYPLVIWTTGWDWFLSLPAVEQGMMVEYLRGGGRLLISSQDLLNRVDNPELTEDYLGVFSPSYEVTPTVALAPPGGLLGLPAAAWPLNYPFINWSDGLQALPGAEPLLFDTNLNALGVANLPASAPGARTLFYSFPLESLPEDALADVLRTGMLWLGPFGGSALTAPEIALAGSRIAVSLRLVTAETGELDGLTVRLRLPPGTAVVPGSIAGPWLYDPPENSLVWDGSLAAGAALSMTVELDLDDSLQSGTMIEITGELSMGDGRRFPLERRVVVDGPFITVEKTYSPGTASFDANLIEADVVLTNAGAAPGPAVLTDTIPAGLTLVPGSLLASDGSISVLDGTIVWAGTVDPWAPVVITYQALATFPQTPGLLVGYAEVWDGLNRRGDWAIVEVPGSLYFPQISR